VKSLGRALTSLGVIVLAAGTVVAVVPAASATTKDPSAALPTLTELRTARLKLSDLPSDYRRAYSGDGSSSSTSTSSDPACSKKLDELDNDDSGGTAPREAKADYRLDKTVGPFVGTAVAAWRTRAPAIEGIASIRSLLRACDRWTETDTDGTTATVRLTRLPMPALGAERIAFRAKITLHQGLLAITARADFAVVRVRSAVTAVNVISFGAADGIDLVGLTRLSTSRLTAVV
jgi:hypothetical protein